MLSMRAWFEEKLPRRRNAVLRSRAERCSQPSSPRTASKASEPVSQGSPDATSSVPEPADATNIAPLATAAGLGVDYTKLEQWRKRGGGDLEPVLASGAVAASSTRSGSSATPRRAASPQPPPGAARAEPSGAEWSRAEPSGASGAEQSCHRTIWRLRLRNASDLRGRRASRHGPAAESAARVWRLTRWGG